MKNRTKNQIMWLALVAVTALAVYMWYNPRIVKVPVQPSMPVPPRPIET